MSRWPFTTATVPASRRSKRREAPAPRPAAKTRVRPAAGVLLRHHDAEGYWYLLGLRTYRLGGTWANLGGSLERGEDALAGALRELSEETEIRAAALEPGRIVAELQTGSATTPYTLFVIDVPEVISDAVLQWEHDELWWWHSEDVPDLHAHAGLEAAWPAIAALEDQ